MIQKLLEEDRAWSAYALADLDPQFADDTEWYTDDRGVILIYRGLHPPVLVPSGEFRSMKRLFKKIPSGTYTYTFLPEVRDWIGSNLAVHHEQRMWRMILASFSPIPRHGISPMRRLDHIDLPEVLALFGNHPDRPDSFTEDQLRQGVFYGAFRDSRLVSVAGTHILSRNFRVSAIGNVFTDPEFRNLGYGTQVTEAVVNELIEDGIETIVLNVAIDNAPAIASYQHLGFKVHCEYLEGTGELKIPIMNGVSNE